jgi:hypothetical protein
MVEMSIHWHVSTGLEGYGPGGATQDNEFDRATTWPELADLIKDELNRASEAQTELADSIAGEEPYEDDGRDYREAWITLKRAEDLATKAMQFDNRRADASIYKDDPDAWDTTIERMAREIHLTPLGDHSVLHVWECAFPDICKHGRDEDDS